MRKVMLLIIMLLGFSEVKAKEDNSYKEYRYRFYKEEKEGEYIRKDLESNYEFTDSNDITYGKYGDYLDECPNYSYLDKYYKIEYCYIELLPVLYIKIINKSSDDILINNILIYELDSQVDYNIYSCDNCEDNINIKSGSEITILLSKEIYLRDLKINIDTLNKVNYEIIYSNNPSFDSNSLVAKNTYVEGKTEYMYDETYTLYNNYTSLKYDYDINEDNFIKILSERQVCKSREIKTYRYNIIRKYYDNNYYKDVQELKLANESERKLYKKDLNDYKVYYIEKTTPINNEKNYKYLIIYILFLILIALILIKKLKKMSNEIYS